MSLSAWWVCGDRQHHYFEFGQLAWHLEEYANQGLDKGHLIPNSCQSDLDGKPGEPCLDSTHLYGPFDDKATARVVADARRLGDGMPLRDESSRKLIAASRVKTLMETAAEELETVQDAQKMAAMRRDTPSWHGQSSLLELDEQFRRGLDRFL